MASNSPEQEQAIRELAHKKWQEAGCPPSDGVEFWCAAERELNDSANSYADEPASSGAEPT